MSTGRLAAISTGAVLAVGIRSATARSAAGLGAASPAAPDDLCGCGLDPGLTAGATGAANFFFFFFFFFRIGSMIRSSGTSAGRSEVILKLSVVGLGLAGAGSAAATSTGSTTKFAIGVGSYLKT